MPALRFLFLLIPVVGFAQTKTDTLKSGQAITITGIAGISKYGALVQTGNKHFYLDKIEDLPAGIDGKNIRVSGKLLIRYVKPPATGEPVKAKISGLYYTILKPRWELAEQ